jgi:predicted Zn-dependent protease with MMP-like domain
MRGPLAPAAVPLSRSRAEVFDDLVLDTVELLEARFRDQLDRVQFAVEDVPPLEVLGRDSIEPVPLGSWSPGVGDSPAQIVIYRRPIEARATGIDELGDLVHDVVVEEVAELLGLDPQSLDPGYGD